MEQRNWKTILVRLAIFLVALAILGGAVKLVVDRAERKQEPTQQAPANTPASETDNQDEQAEQPSDKELDDIARGDVEEDESEEADNEPSAPRGASQLPTTGPAEAVALLTAPAAGYSALQFAKSRRAIKRAHRR